MSIIVGIESRHQAIQDVCRRFEMDNLVDPDARQIAVAAARFASEMVQRITRDDPELTRALTSLADSRDAFIRAKLYQKIGG